MALFSRAIIPLALAAPHLPVPVPAGVSCVGPPLAITWEPVAGSDLYDVAYGPLARPVENPFGWQTSERPHAVIHGLAPGAGYWFKVRAHVGGIGGYGNDTLWSTFTAPVYCNSTHQWLVQAAVEPAARSPRPRYQLIYRITETLGLTGPYRPPDFLRDHNSADSLGSASFLTWAVLEGLMSTTDNVSLSTITEYCVEMVDRPWAAYMSCVPGGNYTWQTVPRFQAVDSETCYCAKGDDRSITHRDMCTNVSVAEGRPAYLQETCPAERCHSEWANYITAQPAGEACMSCTGVPCSEMSSNLKPLCLGCNQTECTRRWALSRGTALRGDRGDRERGANRSWSYSSSSRRRRRRRLQGWELPCNCSAAETSYGLTHVGATNLSYPPGVGTWFSTPQGGQCREGASLGGATVGGNDTCTWRRLPSGRIIYGFELVANGFTRPADRHAPNGEELQRKNGKIFAKTWANLPIERTDACADAARNLAET